MVTFNSPKCNHGDKPLKLSVVGSFLLAANCLSFLLQNSSNLARPALAPGTAQETSLTLLSTLKLVNAFFQSVAAGYITIMVYHFISHFILFSTNDEPLAITPSQVAIVRTCISGTNLWPGLWKLKMSAHKNWPVCFIITHALVMLTKHNFHHTFRN